MSGDPTLPFEGMRSTGIDESAKAVKRFWPGKEARLTVLSGGITNSNYRVDVSGASYVLRIGGKDTNLLGIDRATEHEACLRAAEIGVGPAVIGFVETEGWLVTSFIRGRPIPPEEVRSRQGIRRVAAALRKVHGADAIPGRFDAFAVVDQYRAEAQRHGVWIPAEFTHAHYAMERIRRARGLQPQVPCHNDLLNANFLDDGEVRIVDWEYAGMGDRFFDLANLSVNHDFGLDEDRALLAAYFGAERPEDLASLRLMRLMSDFREAMWGVLQSGISGLDFDFTNYANKHFNRLLVAASDPEFEHYLRRASAGRMTD
jgi:thiamine kinase-like enzyme